MYGLHAWMFPLAAAFMWCATLLAMIITWAATGRPIYASQDGSIPYISDIGASYLKPLFVTGSIITGLGFFLSVLSERIYRMRGKLLPNVRRRGAVLGVISCICAMIAAAGLGLLSGFDTLRYTSLHRLFLLIFMLGTVLSAIATTIEFLVLKREARHAAGFADVTDFSFNVVRMAKGLSWSYILRCHNNVAAILEWTIAFVFVFYVISFYFDLRPAAGSPDGKYDVSGIGDRLHVETRGGRRSGSAVGLRNEGQRGEIAGASDPEMQQLGGTTSRSAA
ncbi:Frag1 domain-containing protein [Ceratobasidium sp. AG-Ba]|nr:Frag1 domain-containing protein [Ceratobasidium sp. AG-Ba]